MRPVTAGDRRNRRDQRKPMSANRAASIEHVGEVLVHYVCDECGECVKPGETHVRHLVEPGKWVLAKPRKGSKHKGRAVKYRQKRATPGDPWVPGKTLQGDALREYHRYDYQRNLAKKRQQRQERDKRYRERLRNARLAAEAKMRRIPDGPLGQERRQADS